MQFEILGPLEVSDGERQVPIGGPKQRTLLAAFLVEPNRVVSTNRLAAALWPGDLPTNAVSALQTNVSRLRTLLDAADTGDSETDESRLVSQGQGYLLRVGETELDALRFEALSRESEEARDGHRWQVAVDRAEEALGCWRGPALEEFAHEEFAAARAAELEELRLRTVECHADASLALGRHRELVGGLEQAVVRHPLRERLWYQLMLALYRSDRQSEALRAFQRVRAVLGEELGITPGAELVRLEQVVLEQDPALDWHPEDEHEAAPAAAPPARDDTTQREVTFLFTDVDNSAALWDRDPAIMTAALQQHDAVLQTTIDRHGGEVIARPGDGFCVVFDRAGDAISCALEAQKELRAGLQGAPAHLRVRVAVHTGDAELRGGNYFGVNVNRVARMRDAAHGAQILVSASTRELVVDALPDRSELVDIGRWLFEGFTRSERVYQLVHPELESGFPPLRSGQRRTGGIPRHSTSFVGRAAETELVGAALTNHPLVTITGEGGIGKTRLALEVVHRTDIADYPDGIWFCDLAAVHDTNGLLDAVASAIGVSTPAGSDARAALVASLQEARLLLLLDNCEQVAADAAGLLADVLARGTAATILATSRAPLRVAGEQVVDLSPLSYEQLAVQLLVDRAVASGASVDQDDPALAEIARKLDGVPLAIELAAPRLASMSPAALAARLHQGSDLLSGPATIPERQRTLRATIEWSFNLLGAEAQRLFCALSVFRGGWTLDSAESLAPAADVDSDAVAPLIAELSDQSMIRIEQPTEGTARYRMLETMRAYGADRLADSGYGARVEEEHALRFIATAEAAARHRRGPMEPAWVRQLDVEFDNIRAAYQWSIRTGRPHEGLRLVAALAEDIMRERLEIGRWATELAARPEVQDDPLRPVALAVAGHVAMIEYKADDAIRLSHEALEAEHATGAAPSWIPHTTLALLGALGLTEDDVREHIDAMVAISRDSGDPLAAAIADFNLALIAWGAGQPEKGLRPAERLLAAGVESQNPTMLAMGLLAHGRATAPTDPEGAAGDYHDALVAASTAHNTVLARHALRAIQELKSLSGDQTGALAALRNVAESFEKSGNVTEQLHTVVSMLDALMALGAWELLATICGALSRTPWRITPASRLIEEAVAQELGRVAYHAARRRGTMMRADQLVSFVSTSLREMLER